jgi:Ran GTPase-activating protein (RanGAP) involved in mRNA processing and transport
VLSDDDAFDMEFIQERFRDSSYLASEALKLPRALANGLQHNSTLRTIDLSSCGLPDEALGIVLQALVGHATLEVLDVSKNRAGPQTIGALAEMIAHPDSNLTELDLREQRKLPKRLAAKKKNKKLGVFGRKKAEKDEEDGGSETMDHHGGLDLFPLSQAMYNNEMLQVLKLSHNQLTDDQVSELVRNLQGNETLIELDLQFNSITARGLQSLTKGLSHLPCLKVLLLGGNDFGKEGTKILAQLEDDDDSVCTILEEGTGRRGDEDDETFHSAKSSNTKTSSDRRKTKARSKALSGLMGGLTGISEK